MPNEPKHPTPYYRQAMAIARKLSRKPTKGAVKAWAGAMLSHLRSSDLSEKS